MSYSVWIGCYFPLIGGIRIPEAKNTDLFLGN